MTRCIELQYSHSTGNSDYQLLYDDWLVENRYRVGYRVRYRVRYLVHTWQQTEQNGKRREEIPRAPLSYVRVEVVEDAVVDLLLGRLVGLLDRRAAAHRRRRARLGGAAEPSPASAAVLGLRVATCRIDMSDLCLSLADPTRATCPTHGKSSQIRASKRTILPGTAFAGRARARLTRRDTDTKAHALSALDGWCRGWWRRAQALRAGRKPRPLVALHRSRC